MPLIFRRAAQRFEPTDATPAMKSAGKRAKKDAGWMQQALAALWASTTSAWNYRR